MYEYAKSPNSLIYQCTYKSEREHFSSFVTICDRCVPFLPFFKIFFYIEEFFVNLPIINLCLVILIYLPVIFTPTVCFKCRFSRPEFRLRFYFGLTKSYEWKKRELSNLNTIIPHTKRWLGVHVIQYILTCTNYILNSIMHEV